MGFVLPRNPNPLVTALASINESVVKRATEGRENKLIGEAFQKLNDPSISPLEQLSTLSQLDVSTEKKQLLGKGLEYVLDKQQKAEKERVDRQLNRDRSIKLATNLGLENPEQWADVEPAQIVASYKAKNPAPKGGVTAQPIPPEHLNKMNEIDAANPRSSPAKRAQLYAEAQIPESSYKFRIESQGGETEASTKEKTHIHEMSEDYDKDLIKSYKNAKKQIELVKDLKKDVESGKIKPSSISNLLKGYGHWGDKIADAFKSGEEGKLEAAMPQLLEGWKEVFGIRLSDADLRVLQDKLPSLGKSPEANKAVLDIIEKYAKPNIVRYQIARKIKKENSGYRPIDYIDRIEELYEESNAPKEPEKSAKPLGEIFK